MLHLRWLDEQRASRDGVSAAAELVAVDPGPSVVLTEVGRGTYARPIVPVRRVASERYRKELEQVRSGELGTSFTVDQQVKWSAYSVDADFREVPASEAVAELFDVEPGTMLLERHLLFRTHGVPQQMSVSRLLLDMVAGTSVADPENEPWPGGNTSQLYSLGHTITSIRERPAWRLPTPDETEALRIPGGVPVIVITRQTYVNDWVAEVAHIVMRSDRVELDYLFHLS